MRIRRWIIVVATIAGIAFSTARIQSVHAATPGAASVTRYSVLFNGRLSGAQTTSVAADGTIRVDFKYVNNGRGPDLRERFTLADDATPLSFEVKGRSEYGGAVDESYRRRGTEVHWQSSVDQGRTKVYGPTLFVPLLSSYEPRALIVRALARVPSHKLAALPSGTVSYERLQEVRLEKGSDVRTAALFAISGLDLSPTYVWLTEAPQLKLFAAVIPGSTQVIEAGWEEHIPRLESLQAKSEFELLRTLAHRLTHTFPEPIVIRNARVFDSEHAQLLPGQRDVYINRGRIAALYDAGSQAQAVATEIDAHGRVLMPALFDMHDHEFTWNALLQLAGGVTTVRDLGNDNGVLADLMQRIEAGETLGPRIVPLGFIEGDTPFAADGGIRVKSVQEAKAAVDWYAQRGYRQVKIYNSFKPEWVAETAAYAHSRGLRVGGHVPAFMRAEQAIRDGYDELTHINQLMLNFFVKPTDDTRTLLRFSLIADHAWKLDLDSKPVQDFIALMIARGTVHDPTLATFENMFTQRAGDTDPRYGPEILRHLPAVLQRQLLQSQMDVTAANVAHYRASYTKMLDMVGRLYKAGVPLVAGTDDTAGFILHRELELYVKAGIPAPEALRIAVWNGARYSGLLNELGSINTGKRADVILVEGDPTTNISDIRRIALVMKDGATFYPSEIYESLGIAPFVEPARPTQRQ